MPLPHPTIMIITTNTGNITIYIITSTGTTHIIHYFYIIRSTLPYSSIIYTFKYKEGFKWDNNTYTGVMADEVPENAVVHRRDYDMVDYSKIDVDFKKIN
jgi:lipopolysaccharide export LptBFGC system permease protein LptF